MGRFGKLPLVLAAAVLLVAAPSTSQALSLSKKAGLQAAMQRHIDQQSIGGVYLHLDHKTGKIKKLHAVTAHPMIMQMGDNFVLCFDFRDDAGGKVNVDFYMAPKKKSFVVFHAAIDDRAFLNGLMDAGKVSRAE